MRTIAVPAVLNAILRQASGRCRTEMCWNRINMVDGNPEIMKTTVDIPDDELADLMRFTRASTKREGILTAIADYNRRRRMAALAAHAGKGATLMTPEELQAQRRKG